MTTELQDIKKSFEKLRQDLMASNMALCALISVMPQGQQKQALAAFASLAVQQEQTFDKLQLPGLIAPMQAAHQRLYTALDGSIKMKDLGFL